MKSIAVYPAKREIKLIECEEPNISKPTDVKLKMLEVGICGTDKEIAAFEYGDPPEGSEFLIIGHESLGEVIEVGANVVKLKPGDLVVPMVRRPCPFPDCLACRSGRQDFCYTGGITERGIKKAHGFMAEFVVDDEMYMNLVPKELRDVAVLVEPLTISEKAMMEVGTVQQRLPWACKVEAGKIREYCHRAVVLGAGPIGLLGAMKLVSEGYQTCVYSLEPADSPRAKIAESIGAKYFSSKDVSIEELSELAGNVDLIFEAVGAAQIAFQVMKILGTNGVFIFSGVPGRKGPIELDVDCIMKNLVLKNQVVFGTVNANRDAFEAAIRDLGEFKSRWPEAVRSLISNRLPMESYIDLLLGRVSGIKNVIEIE